MSPWPPQAIHFFEKDEKIKDDFFDKIYASYKKAIKDENKLELEDSPWWSELRKEFQEIFLGKDGIDKNAIINFRNDINSKSVSELTQEANDIISQLEKEKNLENSLEDYQKLIKLNNIIEKKFQNSSKKISLKTKDKISQILSKKNEKRIK